jgi:NADPH:quinone reductase-like Zn-dependent oxidoreductase
MPSTKELISTSPVVNQYSSAFPSLCPAAYVFDAAGGSNIGPCIGALRRGGTLVGFGFMSAPGMLSQLTMFANIFLGSRQGSNLKRRDLIARPLQEYSVINDLLGFGSATWIRTTIHDSKSRLAAGFKPGGWRSRHFRLSVWA